MAKALLWGNRLQLQRGTAGEADASAIVTLIILIVYRLIGIAH